MSDGPFRHILVPTDGSEPSLRAAHLAIRLAGTAGRLTVLNVVDELVVKELARFGKRPEAEVRPELEEHGRRYVDLIREDAARDRVPAERLVRSGNPFEEIVAAARELEVDLIVMGHVGRRGTGRVLIGSVTSHVLDFAPCPVLIVKGRPETAL